MLAHDASVMTLHPGDVARGSRGDQLATLLGSCVSIVLTDPQRTVAVMCHIVHPTIASASARATTAFADVAFTVMEQLLLDCGLIPSMCDAYVYGGGNMFPSLTPVSVVGDANVRRAFDWLSEHGVPVRHCDVGGTVFRQLQWTIGVEAPSVTAITV